MAIGQIALGSGWRQQSVLAQVTQPQAPLDTRSEQLAREMPLLNRSGYEPVKAGFGDGTVSVPTETVYALGRNMNSVRNLVPSSEEAHAKFQERIAELRADGFNAPRMQTLDMAQPRAMAGRNAIALINEINDAAKTAKQALGGQEATTPENTPTIRVGNETIPMRRTSNRPLLDVFA